MPFKKVSVSSQETEITRFFSRNLLIRKFYVLIEEKRCRRRTKLLYSDLTIFDLKQYSSRSSCCEMLAFFIIPKENGCLFVFPALFAPK